MEFKYEEIYKYPINICLNVTDSCNLACKYCFVQQKPHFMTLDLAKKTIDWLIDNLNERNKLGKQDKQISVNFFGGEPTLLYDDIIVPLVLYTEENYPNKVHFGITTNGTLLNRERIDFLTEHKVHILLSIDGNKITQNFNRPQRNGEGSFELIEKNIPYLLKKQPDVVFRATLYQPTVKYLYENYKYAEKMGFKNIFFCPNAREEWTKEHIEEMNEQLKQISIDRIITYEKGKNPIHFSTIDKIFKKILDHDLKIFTNKIVELEINRLGKRCGLGTTSASVNFEGLVFACQEQDSRDTNDYFYIGNIFEGIDIKKHQQLLYDYKKKAKLVSSKKELCETCLLRNTCFEDICPSVSHDLYGEFFIRPEIDCIFNNCLMENCIKEMDILVNKSPSELFKKYLDSVLEKKEG